MRKVIYVLLTMSLLLLFGCAQQGGRQYRGRWMGNMSDAERQQMMQQMREAATAACQDKAEGDACAMQSPRGERSGTCATQNSTLMCRTQMRNGQYPGAQQPTQ